jgi:TRAP-type mannitol/chloroaromatic compound transport system permease small subunit
MQKYSSTSTSNPEGALSSYWLKELILMGDIFLTVLSGVQFWLGLVVLV